MNSQEIKNKVIDHCNILAPIGHNLKDEHGCILEKGHGGAHVFINKFGKSVTWEFDLSCECGCNDTDDFNDTCIIYF